MSNDKVSIIERFAISLYDNGFLKGNGTEINDILEYYKEMYKDEMEAAIIKQCVEQSTSNASSYSDGYNKGYMTALQYIKFMVDDRIKTITQ